MPKIKPITIAKSVPIKILFKEVKKSFKSLLSIKISLKEEKVSLGDASSKGFEILAYKYHKKIKKQNPPQIKKVVLYLNNKTRHPAFFHLFF